jgi:hypothetical protein
MMLKIFIADSFGGSSKKCILYLYLSLIKTISAASSTLVKRDIISLEHVCRVGFATKICSWWIFAI